nr:immunoglobulin heavy chain junction region [Mus musculus]
CARWGWGGMDYW